MADKNHDQDPTVEATATAAQSSGTAQDSRQVASEVAASIDKDSTVEATAATTQSSGTTSTRGTKEQTAGASVRDTSGLTPHRPKTSGEVKPAIVVKNVHEIFKVYANSRMSLRERLISLQKEKYTLYHALNGVNVTIMPGERVGLVGHNGSGKSTLLKVMAKILPPDRGSIEINGRMATLLELGAGFSPELTGRENMYLNGSILGLTRAEVDESFDRIVDFAGVRDFIDSPVKNYSSGMYVRLGFAIAVHVDPDILLVDEVLAVGDQTFQERSLSRMKAFAEAGKTVVLVSHDLASIQNLCDRVIVLEHGHIVFDGPAKQGIDAYNRRVEEGKGTDTAVPELPELSEHEVEEREKGDGKVVITNVEVVNVQPELAPPFVDPRPEPVQQEFPYKVPYPEVSLPNGLVYTAPDEDEDDESSDPAASCDVGATNGAVERSDACDEVETKADVKADDACDGDEAENNAGTADTDEDDATETVRPADDKDAVASTENHSAPYRCVQLPPATPISVQITGKVTDDSLLQTGLYVRLMIRRTDIPNVLYDARTSWQTIYLAAPPADHTFTVTATFTLNALSGTYAIDTEIGNTTTEAVHAFLHEGIRLGIEAPPWEFGIVPMGMTFAVTNPDGVWPPESVPPALADGGPAVHPSPLWPLSEE